MTICYRSRRTLPLLLALTLLLMPGSGLSASRSLPIDVYFTLALCGDGQTAYACTMEGHLFRYQAGESRLEPLPLRQAYDSKTDTLMGMCVINGGVYYLYYDSNILHLMYAEAEGLPETIAIPVRDVKGARAGSYIKHLVCDG
jgi:hypothetical protein